MAQQKSQKRSSTNRSRNSSRNGRSASQKPEKYRFAQNVPSDGTMAEREYQQYAAMDPKKAGGDADVLLDVPVLKVDEIHLEVDDLRAHVSVNAEVHGLLKLNVGVEASLGKVKVDITGVEAQALLKVRLDHIAAMIDRVLTTVDRNPELLKSVGRAVEDIGSGTGEVLADTGEAAEEVGAGAKELQGIGQGGGQALAQLGQGVAGTAGQTGSAAAGAGGGAGKAAGAAGKAAGAAGKAAGKAGEDIAEEIAPGDIAKVATKTAAKEVRQAAKLEAKGLKLAASQKAKELKQRRRERKAEQHNATERAMELARETGVDLDDVKGSGAEGRITVEDVRSAAD